MSESKGRMAQMQKSGYLLLIFLLIFPLIVKAGDKIPEDIRQKIAPYEEEIRKLVEKAQKRKDEFLPEAEALYNKQKENSLHNAQEISGIKQPQVSRLLSSKDERLYIFMSSSVPLTVWQTYAEALEIYGLKAKGVLVLRGCIGGCTKIRPTIEFIKKVLKVDSQTPVVAQVYIDPLLFRFYNIKQVPCFVYARGIDTLIPDLSEGRLDNLKAKPDYKISCGDWAFEYHMEKLGLVINNTEKTR